MRYTEEKGIPKNQLLREAPDDNHNPGRIERPVEDNQQVPEARGGPGDGVRGHAKDSYSVDGFKRNTAGEEAANAEDANPEDEAASYARNPYRNDRSNSGSDFRDQAFSGK